MPPSDKMDELGSSTCTDNEGRYSPKHGEEELYDGVCVRVHQTNQILMPWSTLPEATARTAFSGSVAFELPLMVTCGLNARVVTKCSCATIVCTHSPVDNAHTRIVLSSEADRRNLPDGWYTRALIQFS